MPARRTLLTIPTLLAMPAALAIATQPAFADPFVFTPGDLVIDTVTAQSTAASAGGGYGLDTAAPIVLQEYAVSGTGAAGYAGSLTLPQLASGANAAISGEYGSASEGMLQLSGNGQYLTVMGYGVNAGTFNAAGGSTGQYGTAALGQTTSLTGGTATTVPRVVALIGGSGSVDTSTALTGVFNTNNPRSAYTVNGTSFYVSGQGASKTDPTQGIFYAQRGATTATVIDNSTDTRDVQVVNGTLTVSRDYNPPGSGGQQSNVDTLSGPAGALPTSATGVTQNVLIPTGVNNSSPTAPAINVTAANGNGVDNAGPNSRVGTFVYASPEQFFFASPTVLYVADSGSPKNGNADKAALGDGGLQKWDLINGTWVLEYTLSAGLSLVDNNPADATGSGPNGVGGENNDVTGLFGLTGEVLPNGEVELYATSYTKNELDTTYVYGITDTLSATTLPTGESFTTLVTSSPGEEIRGLAFAPVPEPASWSVFGLAVAVTFTCVFRRRA